MKSGLRDECRIKTPMSKDMIVQTLQLRITKGNEKKYSGGEKFFTGDIYDDRFIITTMIKNYRGFQLVFKGEIMERDGGSEVVMQADLYPIAKAFLIIWLCMCLIFFSAGMIFIVIFGRSFSFGVIIPLLLAGFGYVFTRLSFKHVMSRTKTIFSKLLCGEYVKEK